MPISSWSTHGGYRMKPLQLGEGGSRGQRPFGRFYLLIALAQAFLKIVREKVLPIVILNNTEPFIIHNTLGTKART